MLHIMIRSFDRKVLQLIFEQAGYLISSPSAVYEVILRPPYQCHGTFGGCFIPLSRYQHYSRFLFLYLKSKERIYLILHTTQKESC